MTNAYSDTVSVIDTASNTVIATIVVGDYPIGVAITPDGSHAYVANHSSDTVSVIDTGNNAVVATIAVGHGPTYLAIKPDGSQVWVPNQFAEPNTLSVIDTGSNTVVTTIVVNDYPNKPNYVAFAPDGSRAYVINHCGYCEGNLLLIDTASYTVIHTIGLRNGPSGVAITPDGSRAYVTHYWDPVTSVIDTGSLTEISLITMDGGLTNIALTPDGSRAYVTHYSGRVSVIDTTTNLVIAYIGVGPGSHAVAITSISQSYQVTIDIKPGSFPNSINPNSKGVIPVAILTTSTFDATTVDSTTVLFGATGIEAVPVQSALEDVDGDLDTDMILHFNTQDTGIVCGDTSASLTGKTLSGQEIDGSDSVNTVGCE